MTSHKISYQLTGYSAVDLLNQDLFDLYYNLLSACSIGQGAAMIDEVFNTLNHYATTHFPDEEDLMIRYEYPDFSFHQMQHLSFTKLEAQLKEEYLSYGMNNTLLAKITSFLTYWLYIHINQSDTKMTDYFEANRETFQNSYSI